MYGTARTLVFALAAQTALVGVDVGKVCAELDGFKLAGLDALAAADTTVLTFLGGKGSLVLVVAKHYDFAVLGSLRTQLDDAARTCLGACATACTLALVYFGNTGGRIDFDSSEETRCFTVTLAKTAPLALGLTHACHILDTTRVYAVKLDAVRTGIASTVASHHSDFWRDGRCLQAKDTCYLLHDCLSAWSAIQIAERPCLCRFDTCRGKTLTPWVAATATICLWQYFAYLLDARVFPYSKLLFGRE